MKLIGKDLSRDTPLSFGKGSWVRCLGNEKDTIDARATDKSAALQAEIDKYNCTNVYSIENFKKEIYLKRGITDSNGTETK